MDEERMILTMKAIGNDVAAAIWAVAWIVADGWPKAVAACCAIGSLLAACVWQWRARRR
ncbi:MAG: hypothetical protein GTN75_01570 [Gemmatimonadetes bacterium]|nr:hypothetical protein [Gemmatimonadota bacterium]